jgi:predicted nucleotidyltransferase
VKRERWVAKFWLDPMVLATNRGFAGHELNQIARLVMKHEPTLLEAWHEYFGA